MSPIDSILGIEDLVVHAVRRSEQIHVWAGPRQRPSCPRCAGERVRIKATHRRTLKHTRQGNQLMVLHAYFPPQTPRSPALPLPRRPGRAHSSRAGASRK